MRFTGQIDGDVERPGEAGDGAKPGATGFGSVAFRQLRGSPGRDSAGGIGRSQDLSFDADGDAVVVPRYRRRH
jgi:hypothetical protein